MMSMLQAQIDSELLAVQMDIAHMLGLNIMESAIQAAKDTHRV